MSPNQNLYNAPLPVVQWSINYTKHGHLAVGCNQCGSLMVSKIKAAITCGCEIYNDAVTVSDIVYCKMFSCALREYIAITLCGCTMSLTSIG